MRFKSYFLKVCVVARMALDLQYDCTKVGTLTIKEEEAMCCGTAKSPCIEMEINPSVAENCCGTAKSPCIEMEINPGVAENCCGTAKSPCIEIEASKEVKENSAKSSK